MEQKQKRYFYVVISTAMRSGTHLMMDLMRKNFDDLRAPKWPLQSASSCYVTLDLLIPSYNAPSTILRTERAKFFGSRTKLLKVHFTKPDFSNLEAKAKDHLLDRGWKGVYVVRDPRKVLMSTYAFMFDECRKKKKSAKDFDIFAQEFIPRWVKHVELWIDAPNVMTVKFEDILGSTTRVLERLEGWLELPLGEGGSNPLPRKFASVWSRRLQARLKVHPESTEIQTSIKPGNWREALDRSHQELIKTQAGRLMERFNYDD